MILTVTLNPSVDRRYTIDNFDLNQGFRTENFQATPGGKGINVAKVLKILGEDTVATGFIGGKSGEFIGQEIEKLGIQDEFVKIDGETRTCIAILSKNGGQTEILESGPTIGKKDIDTFLEKYLKLVKRSKIITISGSLPKGLDNDIYRDLIRIAKEENKKVILDTSGEALVQGIKELPYLIKPNEKEVEVLTERNINSENDLIKAGKELIDKGIENVVVSLGSKGSICFTEDEILRVDVPDVKAVNPVGSGDSMVAGLAYGYSKGYNIVEQLKIGSACGTSNAMENETGHIKLDVVKSLKDKIIIDRL